MKSKAGRMGSAAGVAKGLRNSSVDDADKEADLCAVKFKGRKRKVPGLRPRSRRKG